MSLYDRFHPIVRAARSKDADRFLEVLVKSEVWFIAAPSIDGVDPAALPPEDLPGFVERVARAATEQELLEPWRFEVDGKTVFPIFSSQGLLERFLQTYVTEVNRIIPFNIGRTMFLRLVDPILASDQVVLNPRSAYLRTFGADELALLAEAAATRDAQ